MSVRFALSLVLVASTVSACGSEQSDQRTGVKADKKTLIPDRLVLLPGATGIERSDDYDGLLRYKLDVPYPAESAITMLSKSLEENGWTATQKDIFNPTGTTALREWSVVESDRVLFTWTAYWENRGGDILQINVTYPTHREDGEIEAIPPAEWHMIAFSRATADALQKRLKQ